MIRIFSKVNELDACNVWNFYHTTETLNLKHIDVFLKINIRLLTFSHLHKQQPQINVSNITPVDHFTAKKFSKQQHLQALKLERPLQFFTKSLAIVTMSSTY